MQTVYLAAARTTIPQADARPPDHPEPILTQQRLDELEAILVRTMRRRRAAEAARRNAALELVP